ncbi:MAG: DUF2862 domain-containing protein [Gloeomargarita sp. DG02_4_bins_56]
MAAEMYIGQQVRVCCLKDRVGSEVGKKLGQVGIVADMRVVDGKGIGLIVRFSDQSQTWFFPEELEPVFKLNG